MDEPTAPQYLRGSDGWDYDSIADRLLGTKSFSSHNFSRAILESERKRTERMAASVDQYLIKQVIAEAHP